MLPVQSSLNRLEPGNVIPFPSSTRAGIGRAPGTFGELLQGALVGESNNFLVTFPISRESIATFQPDTTSREVKTYPPGKRKSGQLARRLLDSQGIQVGGTLVFLDQLPEGKGLASSSADMVASARAVSDYYDFDIDDTALATLLGSIEPTDGVMYNECVSFFHRRCELISRLGTLPPLIVVSLDEGSTVDTLEYNAKAGSHSDEELAEYSHLLKRMSTAIGAGDKRAIGRVATRSAEMNQKYNPKRYFPLVTKTAEYFDALGVVVAHSGTYIGVLLDPMRQDFLRQFSQVQIALSRSARPIEIFRSF
ncbi:MAG: hypothetical protein AB8B99_05455 [Phormidesmis sp.]